MLHNDFIQLRNCAFTHDPFAIQNHIKNVISTATTLGLGCFCQIFGHFITLVFQEGGRFDKKTFLTPFFPSFCIKAQFFNLEGNFAAIFKDSSFPVLYTLKFQTPSISSNLSL